MKNEKKLLYELFDVVRQFVLSAGGDGDGWIISERYRELADLFEMFENNNERWFTRSNHLDETISFENKQEAIFFVDSVNRLPEWAGDIIVKIW